MTSTTLSKIPNGLTVVLKVIMIWPCLPFWTHLPPPLPDSDLPIPLVSLLFLQHGRLIPISGPLPCPDLCKAGSSLFRSLLQYCLPWLSDLKRSLCSALNLLGFLQNPWYSLKFHHLSRCQPSISGHWTITSLRGFLPCSCLLSQS